MNNKQIIEELQSLNEAMWIMVRRDPLNNDPGFMAVAMTIDKLIHKLIKDNNSEVRELKRIISELVYAIRIQTRNEATISHCNIMDVLTNAGVWALENIFVKPNDRLSKSESSDKL